MKDLERLVILWLWWFLGNALCWNSECKSVAVFSSSVRVIEDPLMIFLELFTVVQVFFLSPQEFF